MSEPKLRTGLQLIYPLEKVRCCPGCFKVGTGATTMLRFNFPCKTRWMISIDATVFRVTLLKSECELLRVKFELSADRPCNVRIGSKKYINFTVEDSVQYTLPAECNCSFNRMSAPKIVMNLENNYDNCTIIKTLQSYAYKSSQQFKILLDNSDMSDALLAVGNKEFQVHKTVLAAKSPVFYAMFNSEMKEKKENTVKIDDVDPEVMKQLLTYIYTGAIEADSVDDDQAVNLLKAADKYALEELKFISAKIISKSLTIDNVFLTIGIAEQYKVNYLKKSASYFILCNFSDILKLPDFDLIKPICNEKERVTET